VNISITEATISKLPPSTASQVELGFHPNLSKIEDATIINTLKTNRKNPEEATMKNKAAIVFSVTAVVILLVLGLNQGMDALAETNQSPAELSPGFTYQGYLQEGKEPAEGFYSFSFEIFTEEVDGESLGYLEIGEVEVSGGYFTVILEFEPQIFTGEDRWLEIGVAPIGKGMFTILDGRQKLTPSPYAFYAQNAGALDGRSSSYFQAVVDGTCPEGSAIRVIYPSGSVTCDPNPNHPPVAVLQANPSRLYLGETISGTVTLSMTLSYDPDGDPLEYYFDGSGERQGLPPAYYGPSSYAVHYDRTGDFLAAGWVKDTIGDYARAQALVSVFRFGSSTVTDDALYSYTSIAEVAGRPTIVYADSGGLPMYVRALDVDGTAWGTPVQVNTSDSAGSNLSLAIVDGHPAIACIGYDSYDLWYVRASDPAGNSWGTPVIVDSEVGGIFAFASLVVIEGRPAIAYKSGSGSDDLMYVRANDSTGSTWGTPVTVDSIGDTGQFASMAVVDGYPAIAYREFSNDYLLYVRALDAVGNYWGSPVTVDSAATFNTAVVPSLVVVNGHPAISYVYNDPYGILRYVRANDSTGASWGTPQTLDSSVLVPKSQSMIILDGLPVIAYRDHTNGVVKFITSLDPSGSSWSTPFIIDSTNNVGNLLSMTIVDGRPSMVYEQLGSPESLRFAIPRQD
jgi:hypothetical protein